MVDFGGICFICSWRIWFCYLSDGKKVRKCVSVITMCSKPAAWQDVLKPTSDDSPVWNSRFLPK